jgi:rhomboid protease GluP
VNRLDAPPPAPASPSAPPAALRLPLARPRWVWVFFAINILVWLLMALAGGSEEPLVLIQFGANFSPLIAAGEYWRLFTANFLHVGLAHLLLNSYALYALGPEMEALFGSTRFVVIYLLSGLSGSIASFGLHADASLSAGASTALFGIIGAMIAFFFRNRQRFGEHGRLRLNNYIVIAGLNLIIGLNVPSIDMLGHAGGFAGGLILGWMLCPYYTVQVEGGEPRVVDLNSLRSEWLGVLLFIGLLVAGVVGGVARQGNLF